jgi:ribonuclease PH
VATFASGERKKASKTDRCDTEHAVCISVLFGSHACILQSFAGPRRRNLEIAAAMRKTFEPVIESVHFPRSEIAIYVQIIQSDGGE